MLTRVLRKRAPSEGRVRPQSRDGALGHPVKASFLPILLCSRGTQAGEAVAIDRALPDEKFIDRERVAAASLLQREQTTAHRSYHLCLATDHPAFCPRRWQISDRQWAPIRPHHVPRFRAKRLHRTIGSGFNAYSTADSISLLPAISSSMASFTSARYLIRSSRTRAAMGGVPNTKGPRYPPSGSPLRAAVVFSPQPVTRPICVTDMVNAELTGR
jgi:hypothetical protein